jgi:AraC-like DNA-binding protein/mannose-6-phosphate isomerase-like protein (cupin superfamily)
MSAKSDVQCSREKVFRREDFPLAVYVGSWSGAESDPRLVHPQLELHLICHGNGTYVIGGEDCHFEKNSVLIVHKNETHRGPVGATGSIKNISLILAPRLFKDRPAALQALSSLDLIHHMVLSDVQAAGAECLLTRAADECEHKDLQWKSTVANYIEALLVILQRAVTGHGFRPKDKDPLMQEITEFLGREFTEAVSLSETADKFGLSSYTLSKGFKRYTGVGFRQYIIQLRVAEARKFLETTDMTVSTIAYEVGFGSLSSFNSEFLRMTGVTPGAYRSEVNRTSKKPLMC